MSVRARPVAPAAAGSLNVAVPTARDPLSADPMLPDPIELRAGPVTVRLVDGDLRYVRFGPTELVRRVYATVRDVNWNTPPAAVADLTVDQGIDRFRVGFTAEHRTDQLDYRWRASIEGDPDGTITFAMDGVAMRDFRYSRIGFCLLFAATDYAGSPYRAETPGGPIHGRLPVGIGPQPYVEGIYWPLFPPFGSLTLPAPGGGEVEVALQGDLLELEDQRNWGDGSFKAYCTPSALGHPFEARTGQEFHQRVTLLPRVSASVAVAAEPPASLRLGGAVGPLPELGFGMNEQPADLSRREAGLLRRLHPAHLRVDLRLGGESWATELARAERAAADLGARLEIALFLTDDADAELRALETAIAGASVSRFLIFHEADAAAVSTAPRWLRMACERLAVAAPAASFVAGTNGAFAELNRTRPVLAVADGLCYPMSPQVHLTDTDTLVEALASLPATVRTARDFGGDRPVHVTAISLKPPFNPAATEPEVPAPASPLPASVDVRQASAFLAGWTVACIRGLSEGGAASATFYETTGWRGLMENELGSALPDRFPSSPGMVFPVYEVFADLAAWTGAEALSITASRPLVADGLAVRIDGRTHLLVANLTATAQQVKVGPLPPSPNGIRWVVKHCAGEGCCDQERSSSRVAAQAAAGGELDLQLGPYEVVSIDEEGRD